MSEHSLLKHDHNLKPYLEKALEAAKTVISPTAVLDIARLQVPSTSLETEVVAFKKFADVIIDMLFEGQRQVFFMLHEPLKTDGYKLRKVVLSAVAGAIEKQWDGLYFFDPEFAQFADGREVQTVGTMQAVAVSTDGINIMVVDDLTAESRKQHEYLTSLEEARLRVLADFQNYKRRTESERQEFMTMASKQILGSLIEVIDDYNRAQTMDKELGVEERLQGLERVFEKLGLLLKSQGLEEIAIKTGDKFDPTGMEAIGTVPVAEKEQDNTVVHIDQKGYKNTHNDTVYRTAKVIIGKAK